MTGAEGGLDPDTLARIKVYAKDLMESWPPLTEDQKETIARILGGAGRGERRERTTN